MTKWNTMIGGLVFFTSYSIFAEESKKSPSVLDDVVKGTKEGVGAVVETAMQPWVFVGFDLGRAQVDSHANGEVDMTGTYQAIRGDIDFYFDWVTLEGGFGYFSTQLSGKDANTLLKQKATVATTVLDGAARLRLGASKSFEIGYTNQIFYGTESDFGPVEGANDKNYFYGLSASYHPESLSALRFNVQILRDFTIKTRDVTFAMLGVQYGFAIFGKSGKK